MQAHVTREMVPARDVRVYNRLSRSCRVVRTYRTVVCFLKIPIGNDSAGLVEIGLATRVLAGIWRRPCRQIAIEGDVVAGVCEPR